MSKIRIALVLVSLILVVLKLPTGLAIAADSGAEVRIIRLATTTSTDNSGLLSYLLPEFEKTSGYRVHVIAVGTGKALRMGRDGDADVLLVHAPAAEIAFVDAGYGIERHPVMYNDFVLVGPRNINGTTIDNNILEALDQIADRQLTFISRGDNSGTHKKELSLWDAAGIQPGGRWYREVGQGMGKVLQMAGELDAFTLTDRGTWLAYMDKSPLAIINEDDPSLYNPYHIIAVNPQRFKYINHDGASALVSWITSPAGQTMIGSYTIKDRLLFKPSAGHRQLVSHTPEP